MLTARERKRERDDGAASGDRSDDAHRPERESPKVRQSAESAAKTREQPDLDAGPPDAAERERRDHRGRKRAELGEDGDGLHGEAAREEPAEEVAAAPADAGAESEEGWSHGGLELSAHTNMT